MAHRTVSSERPNDLSDLSQDHSESRTQTCERPTNPESAADHSETRLDSGKRLILSQHLTTDL